MAYKKTYTVFAVCAIPERMPDWLSHADAPYVIAAYGAAAVALLGLLLFARRASRCRKKQWQSLQEKRAGK